MATATSKTTHIQRGPLPWRKSKLTECGLNTELVAVKRIGGAGSANAPMCKVCVDLARMPKAWSTELKRELERVGSRRKSDSTMFFEFQAIGELVTRHRKEFDELVAALQAEWSIKGETR